MYSVYFKKRLSEANQIFNSIIKKSKPTSPCKSNRLISWLCHFIRELLKIADERELIDRAKKKYWEWTNAHTLNIPIDMETMIGT